MFGEEHLPHAAGPELVEDEVAVVAELEPLVLPGRQLVGVELGYHPGGDQTVEERRRSRDAAGSL